MLRDSDCNLLLLKLTVEGLTGRKLSNKLHIYCLQLFTVNDKIGICHVHIQSAHSSLLSYRTEPPRWSWWWTLHAPAWPSSSWPPPSTVQCGGHTPVCHRIVCRCPDYQVGRLDIYDQTVLVKTKSAHYDLEVRNINKFIILQTVISYLSSELCCQCWLPSDHIWQEEARQRRPARFPRPPPAPRWTLDYCNWHRNHQPQAKSKSYNERKVINIYI